MNLENVEMTSLFWIGLVLLIIFFFLLLKDIFSKLKQKENHDHHPHDTYVVESKEHTLIDIVTMHKDGAKIDFPRDDTILIEIASALMEMDKRHVFNTLLYDHVEQTKYKRSLHQLINEVKLNIQNKEGVKYVLEKKYHVSSAINIHYWIVNNVYPCTITKSVK